MGHLEVSHVDYYLPDGRLLLSDVGFRVGQTDHAALVGANGAGKTTLLKILSGELKPDAGTVTTSGGLGVMPQFIGSVRDDRTVRDLLVSVSRPAIKAGARAVDEAELAIMERDNQPDKHAQLKRLVQDMRQYAANSDVMASRYHAAQTRLRKFEEAGPPPEPPRRADIKMRLRGGRTGVRAVTCEKLELTGLMQPFSLEVFYGERVAVLGPNGSGKSHFLRLLAGQEVAHAGAWKLGARVVPGYFAQTHAHPELEGRSLAAILWEVHAKDRGAAMSALRRYELERQGDQVFAKLSGGQQARFQILLLELQGSTALLLDEPTDNLDLESAEALQSGLEAYEGTVLAVTHDRWFARSFDRYLVFGSDGHVREANEPVWNEIRVSG